MRTLRRAAGATIVLLVGGLWSTQAKAHCQMPCGIFDDAARVKGLREDVTTIDKAVKSIRELAAKHDPLSQNQLVRWVTTKEQHADRIIHTVAEYFLAQRIKPAAKGKDYAAYVERLARHHAVMVSAMKCKQSVSAAAVTTLSKAVSAIAGYWK